MFFIHLRICIIMHKINQNNILKQDFVESLKTSDWKKSCNKNYIYFQMRRLQRGKKNYNYVDRVEAKMNYDRRQPDKQYLIDQTDKLFDT